MSELPRGWPEVPLRQLLTSIETGKNLRCEERPPEPHEKGVVKVSSVTWGFFDKTQSKTLPSDYDPNPRSLIRKGDFLISRANTLELVGACVVVEEAPDNLYLSDKILRLVLPDDLKPWLLKFLRSQTGRARIEAASTGNQLSMRNISQEAIRSLMVPLPEESEQRRIVARIDSLSVKVSRARAHLDHIPRLVEKYKQSLLAAAFHGDLTREWRRQRGAIQWRQTCVADVATVVFDGPFGSNLKTADYTSEGVRVMRLENVGHLRLVAEKEAYISLQKYEGLKRHTLQPNDILFSSFIDDEIRVCLLPALPTPAINKSDCFCVRVDPTICSPTFLMYRLASRSTFEQLEATVHGATRPRISLSQLKATKFDLPPAEEQDEIVRRIETAFTWIDRLAAEATSARSLLARLDQAILAKAFRGELVPQDPTDEPASALLARIRAERQSVTARPQRAGRR